ncbi:MAG TPA: shikimate kinase [Candidatus Polarisedimenticolia bacterium]|nr:shikimate kinase [Candidatus Polarisedimenticolia bacterium]
MDKARRGRIFLVGFMGSGKTSVGRLLARELGFRFVDLDQQIELKRGLAIHEIFEREGEPEFRRLEALALRETGAMHDIVVATGGGTLSRWENRDFIQRHGISVWLDAPLSTMLERCRDGDRRPLLSTPERMSALLEERLGSYRSADLHILTAEREPGEVARQIASRVGAIL